MPEEKPKKIRVALMSYMMDNRPGKGTALYGRKLIENLLGDDRFEFYMVHFEPVADPLYKKADGEIIMPYVKLPFASRFVAQMRFFWEYRNKKFDIIHWFQPRIYPFFWFAPAKHIVVTAHGAADITTDTFFVFSRKVFNFVMIHFNQWIDAVIGLSEFAKREIEENYKIPEEKVYVTYLGGGEPYSVLDINQARKRICEQYKVCDPYVLDISRLEPHKNVDGLIGAYIEMRDTSPHKEKLVIVGYPSYGHEKTYARAAESKYKDDIIFLRYIEAGDLNAIYSASRAFVFPSFNEGFGLPLVEAMASGTPIITSNITSLPEVGGDAVIVVDPHKTDEIASAMKRLLGDENLAKNLVERGISRSRLFRWTETAKKTKEIYEEVVQRARS